MANHVLIVPDAQAQKIRKLLEEQDYWDDQYCMVKDDDTQTVAIPIKTAHADKINKEWPQYNFGLRNLPFSKRAKAKMSSPEQTLRRKIIALSRKKNVCIENILNEIPCKWEKHGDLVILPSNSFHSEQWKGLGDDLWPTVAKSLLCKRVARASTITNDGFRSSGVQLLLGESGIVTHIDNGIKYCYDVTKCMFSSGNITEKLRVGSFHCTGETVVDLFAGIGYFTLPFLVKAGAAHVHACEWNPDAVQALLGNLALNDVAHRCTVHEGDNRQIQLSGVADRVNLGLIPSSEQSWRVAVKVLKPTGGVLHLHGNVTTDTSLQDNDNPDGDESNRSETELCSASGLSSLPRGCQEIERSEESTDSTHLELSESTVSVDTNLIKSIEKVVRFSKKDRLQTACDRWSAYVSEKISHLIAEEKGTGWTVCELHVELVKSYAPHIFHVVLDLGCYPKRLT